MYLERDSFENYRLKMQVSVSFLFHDLDFDECGSDPCQNGGICNDHVNKYVCNCDGTGFAGEQCLTSKLLGYI